MVTGLALPGKSVQRSGCEEVWPVMVHLMSWSLATCTLHGKIRMAPVILLRQDTEEFARGLEIGRWVPSEEFAISVRRGASRLGGSGLNPHNFLSIFPV